MLLSLDMVLPKKDLISSVSKAPVEDMKKHLFLLLMRCWLEGYQVLVLFLPMDNQVRQQV